jgi:hypothetical protein
MYSGSINKLRLVRMVALWTISRFIDVRQTHRSSPSIDCHDEIQEEKRKEIFSSLSFQLRHMPTSNERQREKEKKKKKNEK